MELNYQTLMRYVDSWTSIPKTQNYVFRSWYDRDEDERLCNQLQVKIKFSLSDMILIY